MNTICYKTMQMDDPPETTEIQTFVRTVEARSLSRAARELGVPRPTVGRRLARLEQKLGVRLLRRTTRSMALTDAGETFYTQSRAVLAAVRDAEASVRRTDGAVRGLLRIATPPLGERSFGTMLAGFADRYPDVRIEHHAATRHVDLHADGYDVALRAGSELPPGLIARNIARSRVVAVASPAYLAERPAPRRVLALKDHRCIAGFDRGEHPMTHWPLIRGGRVRIDPVLSSNDLDVQREAARSGRGIALLPLDFVYEDIRSGALLPVLPERIGGETVVALVYVDKEFVAPAVRAFIDTVVQWAATEPRFNRKLPACDGHTACAAKPARKRVVRRAKS